MTDNEIIRALECCKEGNCDSCAFADVGFNVADCMNALTENALDLINRQKAEIERLQADKVIAERKEKDARDLFKNTVLQLETAKSEVIKEFAERLCVDRVSNDPVVIAVRAELKMTEGC